MVQTERKSNRTRCPHRHIHRPFRKWTALGFAPWKGHVSPRTLLTTFVVFSGPSLAPQLSPLKCPNVGLGTATSHLGQNGPAITEETPTGRALQLPGNIQGGPSHLSVRPS